MNPNLTPLTTPVIPAGPAGGGGLADIIAKLLSGSGRSSGNRDEDEEEDKGRHNW